MQGQFGGGFVTEAEDGEGAHGEGGGGWGGGFLGASCCEECGCLSFSQEFYDAFKVMVCQSCRRSDKYKLIAKGAAKDTYLLTEGDLKRLGFITKSNPQRKQWSEMKLYLQLQVEQAAVKKHGSLVDLQDTKQGRLQARIAGRMERTKRTLNDLHQQQGPGEEAEGAEDPEEQWARQQAPLNPRQQRVRARLLEEYGPGNARTGDAGAGGGAAAGRQNSGWPGGRRGRRRRL